MIQQLTPRKGPDIFLGSIEKGMEYSQAKAIAISKESVIRMDNYKNEPAVAVNAGGPEEMENLNGNVGVEAQVTYGPQEPVYPTTPVAVQPGDVSQVIPPQVVDTIPQAGSGDTVTFGVPALEPVPQAPQMAVPQPEAPKFSGQVEDDNALMSITQPEESVSKPLDVPEMEAVSTPELSAPQAVDAQASVGTEQALITPEEFTAQQEQTATVPEVPAPAVEETNIFNNPSPDMLGAEATEVPLATAEPAVPEEAKLMPAQDASGMEATVSSDNPIVLSAVKVEELRKKFQEVISVVDQLGRDSQDLMNDIQTSLAQAKDNHDTEIANYKTELNSIALRTEEVSKNISGVPDNVIPFGTTNTQVQPEVGEQVSSMSMAA